MSALSDCGPRASSVNTPNSMALNSVFDGMNAMPVCMIFSGLTCSVIRVSVKA